MSSPALPVSKMDYVRELLKGNPQMKGKAISEAAKEAGYDINPAMASTYRSIILNSDNGHKGAKTRRSSKPKLPNCENPASQDLPRAHNPFVRVHVGHVVVDVDRGEFMKLVDRAMSPA